MSEAKMDSEIHALSESLGHCLKAKNWQIVTAESCTGGIIAGAITSVPGSSSWCAGGFVTYSNEMKSVCLGVGQTLFSDFGAVSRQVVEAMSIGALEKSGASVSVAVSGIAGPDGGTESKPVGTVWLGWCLSGSEPQSHGFHFKGNREQIRKQSVFYGLKGALALCTTGKLCFNH